MKSEYLSDELLRALQPDPQGGRHHVHDTLVPGLAIMVSPAGTKTFVLIGRPSAGGTGVLRWRRIGIFPETSLARARQIAAAWDHLLRLSEPGDRASIHPEKDEGRNTFGSAMEEYLLEQSAVVADRMRREFLDPERNPWIERPLTGITEGDVRSLVEKIRDRPAPAAACSALLRLHAFFLWAGRRGNWGLASNPVIGVTPEALGMVRSPPRTAVLSDELMRAYWAAADATPWPRGPFYQAYALTIQRPYQVAGMLWPQIDAARGLWRIPGDKTSGPRLVPLVPEMLKLLEALRRNRSETCGDFVFSMAGGRQPIGHAFGAQQKFKRKVADTLRRAHPGATADNWRMHDVRRTAFTWLASKGVPNDVIAAIFGWTPFPLRMRMMSHGCEPLSASREALSLWAAHLATATDRRPPQAR
ncbi:tyrosine-type recombinase/integrase [Rhizobium sp. S96]|uniref:tyrosine-type recombinase/integrase n=1 Tax=Rhizobium sp. S96 TaxID=3055140 RepID=UPI0025AA67F0|nr:tyrosine-type recombinase/integrase [Rhizobium sp. S96]MDM9621119.1 tyrosine-type recombinase/integrase [Rhizobium sp. S96]